jgi:hypothetical protein
VKEIKAGTKGSFDGTVRDLQTELAESTATCTVSAANPLIALDAKAQAEAIKRLTAAKRKPTSAALTRKAKQSKSRK